MQDIKPDQHKRRYAGRPVTVGGRRVQVYLDDASLAIAASLGGGNVSDGIRIALKSTGTPCSGIFEQK